MTNAHRPTFNAKRGGEGADANILHAGSRAFSSKDIASHTTLKLRQPGQGTSEDLKHRDWKAELEAREEAAAKRKAGDAGLDSDAAKALDSSKHAFLLQPAEKRAKILSDIREMDAEESDTDDGEPNKMTGGSGPGALDAANDSDSDDSSDDDDDDDDDAELMAELAKLRAEREAEGARAASDAVAAAEDAKLKAALDANPLLDLDSAAHGGARGSGSGSGGFTVGRRWDDDVVFRDQAKKPVESNEREYNNDTIRNPFHRKFLNKFIK